MSGRQGDEGIVAVQCPRRGRSFLLVVEALAVGHAVDVAASDCDCDLDEQEYIELTDRAVGACEAGEREG